jgi:hypothetical protein
MLKRRIKSLPLQSAPTAPETVQSESQYYIHAEGKQMVSVCMQQIMAVLMARHQYTRRLWVYLFDISHHYVDAEICL